MDFKSALQHIVSKKGYATLLNPFLTYSLASDLIGANIAEAKKARLFFTIDSRLHPFRLFRVNGLGAGRKMIAQDFKQFDYGCSWKEFVNAISPISELACPEEFAEYERNRIGAKPTGDGKAVAVRRKSASEKKPLIPPKPQPTPKTAKPAPIAPAAPKTPLKKKRVSLLPLKEVYLGVMKSVIFIHPDKSVAEPVLKAIQGFKKIQIPLNYKGSGPLNIALPSGGKYDLILPKRKYAKFILQADASSVIFGEEDKDKHIIAEQMELTLYRCKVKGFARAKQGLLYAEHTRCKINWINEAKFTLRANGSTIEGSLRNGGNKEPAMKRFEASLKWSKAQFDYHGGPAGAETILVKRSQSRSLYLRKPNVFLDLRVDGSQISINKVR